jgi:hypothetical protein
MDQEWEDKVRQRAHALWEHEGRPEGGAERHWAQAEEELQGEEGHGRAEAPIVETAGAIANTAGTETWTGQDGSVGGSGDPEAGSEAGKDR